MTARGPLRQFSNMRSWLVEELRSRAKSDTDIEALAANEIDRLRRERDHWYDLVSWDDRRRFPLPPLNRTR